MTSDPPSARFVMTRDVFTETVLQGTRERRRTTQTRLAGYGAITLVAAVVWWWIGSGWGGPLLVAAGYFALVAVLHPTLARRRARAAGEDRSDIGRTVMARVTDRDFQVDVEGVSEAAYRLDALHTVESRDEGVLVELFPSEVVWVPDEAFPDRPARAAFERALLAGARLPDPAL